MNEFMDILQVTLYTALTFGSVAVIGPIIRERNRRERKRFS